jgi:glucose dehydrogenase
VDGRPREAVVQLTKQAIAYVFDRRTGEPIWPMVDRPVPQSDVPGERSSPTQPIPTRPLPYDRTGVTVDDFIDFTPELRAEAIEAVRPYRLGDYFAPASLGNAPDGTDGTLALPGTLGGTNWEGGAFDPGTGLLFVGSFTSPSILRLVTDAERSDMDYIMVGGRVPRIQGLPLIKPPYSRVTAIDLHTGEHAWMVPAGDTPADIRNNPALAGIDIGRTGALARPVMLSTATLLFQGEGGGGGRYLHALDKRTGATVASIELPGEVTSIPMTYSVDGKQYIAFWVGSIPDVRTRLVTLALP